MGEESGVMDQLLTEFEKLASEAHQFHPGEWKDCKYTFCRERYVMLEEVKLSVPAEVLEREHAAQCR